MAVIENTATPEGRELGAILAGWCDKEAETQGRDDRCSTCAFRAGDHLANGSPVTLMSALKCAMEREPFWCHETDVPCAGWSLMRLSPEATLTMPWDHTPGRDAEHPAPAEPTTVTQNNVVGSAQSEGHHHG